MSIDAQGFPQYTIGETPVKMRHLGGLSSLDDAHSTTTGYAIIAGLFVQTIDDTLGTHVPLPDLSSVLVGDPLSPPALESYCSRSANGQKLFCQCTSGDRVSVTTSTCSTLLY
ncbi:MAG: hypothetical protein M1491_05580 [Deltaproteobacteria bacterium]|nr:hypothetical protein [Deltaproteobacteria bacterium]MCL5276353.1 hypothetical protein [Deltaproteobacteria bacterium]